MAGPEITLPDGSVALDCGECGAGGAWPPYAADLVCPVCHALTCFRHCPKCKMLVIMPPSITGPKIKAWKCLTCGKKKLRQSWPLGTTGEIPANPALVALYQRIGIPPAEAYSDPDRRRIDGSVLSASGVSGLTAGVVTIFFDRSVATLMIGDVSNPIIVPYDSLRGLQFAGRGEIVSKSGGGWFGGGFGITGIATGVATAAVMNALTTRKKTSIETIVSFAWSAGEVTILSTKFLPAQLGSLMAPALARMQAATQAKPPTAHPQAEESEDMVARLQSLVALRDSGALTEEEFQAAKARIIG